MGLSVRAIRSGPDRGISARPQPGPEAPFCQGASIGITAGKGGIRIERLRPVLDGNRCCGFLMRHIRGIAAHDATGRKVGDYPAELMSEAVAMLRRYASERST